MTVHLISVGVSLVRALETPSATFASQPDLIEAVKQARPAFLLSDELIGKTDRQRASDYLAGALTPAGTPDHDKAKASRVASVAGEARPDLWPASLSAELSTFDRPEEHFRPLPPSDVAVLVCSDTPDGLLAGLWNAAAIVGNDLKRISYLALPQALPDQVRGQAIVVKVSGLDAARSEDFAKAMSQLGALARDLIHSGSVAVGEPFRFYLSGGFKAAIPYLIGLAEGVRSLDPDRPVRAFIVHEDSPEKAPLIGLPLRYLIAEAVESELCRFQNGVRTSVPQPCTLRGYAYDIVGGECHLTPFGAGLRALFEFDPPGLAG